MPVEKDVETFFKLHLDLHNKMTFVKTELSHCHVRIYITYSGYDISFSHNYYSILYICNSISNELFVFILL